MNYWGKEERTGNTQEGKEKGSKESRKEEGKTE